MSCGYSPPADRLSAIGCRIRNNVCVCRHTPEGWKPTPGPDEADIRDMYSEALGKLALHNQSKCEQCVYCALFFLIGQLQHATFVICLLERVLRIPLNVLYFVFLFTRCLFFFFFLMTPAAFSVSVGFLFVFMQF